MKKFFEKLWELMGDEKFTMWTIAAFVTFMTAVNLYFLEVPGVYKMAMVALNALLLAATVIWTLNDKE